MEHVAKLSDIKSPTHIVRCSGVREHAFVVSVEGKQYWKRSWFCAKGIEDEDKIDEVNSRLPEYPELKHHFTGKLNKKLSEYYIGTKLIGFEDNVMMDIPDAIFLQRVSARTKTFDMVFFYGSEPTVFSVVDKTDLDAIRNWFPHRIYSCGADPLPLTNMQTWLQQNTGADMYEGIYAQLFSQEQSSCSEYEPESEPESEDESCDESEDACSEASTDSEYEDSDGEYEPPTKKIKT